MKLLSALLALAIFAGSSYGLWLFGRWVSYKLAYQDMVRAEILRMVRPEALNPATLPPAGAVR